MIDSVVVGGRVVCCEVNRRMENAGLYIQGMEYEVECRDSFISRQWNDELQVGGCDYLAGVKIPIMMEEMGLLDVSVRVNDYAEFVNPKQDGERYKQHLTKFVNEHGLNNCQITGAISALNIRSMLISSGIKK